MTNLILKESALPAQVELDTQIATAKAYPRNVADFMDQAIALVTRNQEIAESCIYCLTRKGKDGKNEIKGPSVRLAEIAASCWGNIHAASRLIENDGKFITAQAVCWDLEKNVKISSDVKRRITTSEGFTYSDDMQVVTGNAACAIALRNAILKVVPKAFVDEIYEAAVKAAVGDQKTFESRRQEIFARLNKMGIENQRIFDFFKKKSIAEFDRDDVIDLIGVGTSIKEGRLSIDKAFMPDAPQHEDAEEHLRQALAEKDK